MNDAAIPWWRVRVSPVRRAVGLLLLTLAAFFFYLMLAKGMRFFVVDSISMKPTLHEGDRLIGFPAESYHRGDIVIVRDPIERGGLLVKRVIGVAGDTVEVRGGAVFLNGKYISEPYRPEPIFYPLPPYIVPSDMIFVLGDNSNLSVDSHNWAAAYQRSNAIVPEALPLESVVARVTYQYFPAKRLGPVHGYPLDRLLEAQFVRAAAAQPLQ